MDVVFGARGCAIALTVVGAVLAGVVAGCNGHRSSALSSGSPRIAPSTGQATLPRLSDWRDWYAPLPAKGVALCARYARMTTVPVLCPATILVPRAHVSPPLTFLPGPTGPTFYEFNAIYGSPSSGVTKPQTHTPKQFFHFGFAGGKFRNGQVAFDYPLGNTDTTSARRLGPANLAGIHGTLWIGRPWPLGGIWGGHLMFIWHHGPYRYLATLHTWLPRNQPRRVLARILQSLKPAQNLRAP
jgi:hypothetical protein